MSALTTHHFLFTAQVTSMLEVDDQSGAALRGNLFEAVWGRFCTNKVSPSCAACSLHAMCPVSALVAPLREENERGRDIPRPYIILPPLGQARRYQPGDTLIFGLTLFGSIVQLLPYIMLSLKTLEAKGLGRKLPENRSQRGKFIIQQIESYQPFTAKRHVLYEAGKPQVEVPTLAVNAADVATRAAELSTDKITVHYLTPTRITYKEKPLYHAAFQPFIQRLLGRLISLEQSYGTTHETALVQCRKELIEQASSISCIEDTITWTDAHSYSSRQKQLTSISGITGKATFAGDLAPFRELLVWGELVHVGKNTVKGNGWYTLEN